MQQLFLLSFIGQALILLEFKFLETKQKNTCILLKKAIDTLFIVTVLREL